MCEKYERCQHTSSTRKFKKIERGVKLCAGRNTTCLATAQQAVCILLAARSCCGHANRGCLLREGVVSQHALRQTPPLDRITDACKNITLPQLRCGRYLIVPDLYQLICVLTIVCHLSLCFVAEIDSDSLY